MEVRRLGEGYNEDLNLRSWTLETKGLTTGHLGCMGSPPSVVEIWGWMNQSMVKHSFSFMSESLNMSFFLPVLDHPSVLM